MTPKEYLKSNVVFVPQSEVHTTLSYFMHQSPVDKVVWDTETTSLDPWSGKTIYNHHKTGKWTTTVGGRTFAHIFGFYHEDMDRLFILYLDPDDLAERAWIASILEARDIMKIGHNIKFDVQMARVSDFSVNGNLWDTLTACRFTHDREPSHSLKHLGLLFSGGMSEDEERWDAEIKRLTRTYKSRNSRFLNGVYGKPKNNFEKKKRKDFVNYSFYPLEVMREYAMFDVWYTFLLYVVEAPEIEEHYADLFAMEMQVINISMEMERVGMEVNRVTARKAFKLLTAKSKQSLKRIKQLALTYGMEDFNPASAPQMMKLLKEKLGCSNEELTNRSSKISTDKDVINRLVVLHPDWEILEHIQVYRICSKLANTYHHTLITKSRDDVNNAIHCNIKASDTATGRSACANPNLQNQPNIPDERKKALGVAHIPSVRDVFVVRGGYVNSYLDYSQIEMRIFAMYCQEQAMLNAFAQNRDLHTETANIMYGSDDKRKEAKAINFGIIFGMGVNKLALTLNILADQAKEKRDYYFELFPGVKNLINQCEIMLRRQGYIEDVFGRRYHIPPRHAYKAVNAIVQGTAANVLKQSMIQVSRVIELKYPDSANLLMPIHDELIEQHKIEDLGNFHALAKLAMEDIPIINRNGIVTTVDVEQSFTTWEDKKEVDVTITDADREEYQNMRSVTLLDLPDRKVDWFKHAA